MLAMWLWTVLVLSESSCAMSLLFLPLARRLKISSSRSVGRRGSRLRRCRYWWWTGMSRMRCSSFPAIWEETTDSPDAVALTAALIASGDSVFRM